MNSQDGKNPKGFLRKVTSGEVKKEAEKKTMYCPMCKDHTRHVVLSKKPETKDSKDYVAFSVKCLNLNHQNAPAVSNLMEVWLYNYLT